MDLKIQLIRDVERYSDFIAKRGNTGTVLEYSDKRVCAKMDKTIVGAEHWNNCIIWEGIYRSEFFDEVLLYPSN